MLAYTIGNTSSYEEGFKNETRMHKLGRSEEYEGGWIWKDREDAARFALTVPFKASVYGVEINSWEEAVSPEPEEDGIHRLLIDSLLVRLP